MIKELYYSTIEKKLITIPIDSVLVADWGVCIELCKEKIKSNGNSIAYIYSMLVIMEREVGKRKLSAKYDCFFWKNKQELIPEEKFELLDIESEPKRIDL